MQARRYGSPRQVAKALGVSPTTVKRWVDDGTLPAQKTEGGHRRILVADVVRMVQEKNWPHVDLSLLTGAVPGVANPARSTEALFEALVSGDAETARRLLAQAHKAGLRVEDLADRLVAPVMTRVGHGWAEGSLDVYQEHRATQVCLTALQGVRERLELPGSEQPLAVGGGPEHDHYLLANVLAELVLIESGWRVVNVGPNTPTASFCRAVRDLRPRLLWISCSHLADVEAFLGGYEELYREAEQAGVAVLVGGQGLTKEVRTRMRYTAHGDGLGQLGAFARHCNSLPGPQRRGDAPPERA